MYASVLCGKLHVCIDFQMAVICEKGGFEALRFIFLESTCLDVPSECSVAASQKMSGHPKTLNPLLVPM